MPVAIRAVASWERRRWLKSRYRSMRYDARFADGREEYGVDLNAGSQGSAFPGGLLVHPKWGSPCMP